VKSLVFADINFYKCSFPNYKIVNLKVGAIL